MGVILPPKCQCLNREEIKEIIMECLQEFKQSQSRQKNSSYLSPDIVKELIDDLNEKAKTSFSPKGTKTIMLLTGLIKYGFTVEDIKAVHTDKVKQWGNDPHMRQYIRPVTLYSNKFEGYLQAAKANGGPRMKPLKMWSEQERAIGKPKEMWSQDELKAAEGMDA